jgi:hypothetical protein
VIIPDFNTKKARKIKYRYYGIWFIERVESKWQVRQLGQEERAVEQAEQVVSNRIPCPR